MLIFLLLFLVSINASEYGDNFSRNNFGLNPKKINKIINKINAIKTHKKIYIIFLVQVIYHKNELNLFILSEPKTNDKMFFLLKMIVEKNEIIIKAEKNSDGNSRIEKFSSILENMDLAYINNIQIKNIKLENNDSSLTYYINYQKNIEIKTKEELLLKDEIDFSDKYQDKKYNINIYEIKDIS